MNEEVETKTQSAGEISVARATANAVAIHGLMRERGMSYNESYAALNILLLLIRLEDDTNDDAAKGSRG